MYEKNQLTRVFQGKEVISGVNIHVKKEGFTVC
ncbi:hypothetical protein COM13_17295 [Bacillus pseudomycoides]|nr:hypothetical protein COO07_12680 [Bacillus pseudomycoides]PEK77264.1 hypothetical protein CN597_19865 [Bacillus pseudomycoides]PEN12205.1 hypothetical protein CN640_04395 [Bacillus pseudomycoides]PGB88101.1 hypothetical protein COM13_17295 [Bacillus pseudomycoides]PHE59348.1 hypothetical protein COF52_01045 [Bacillus pseudomycoides]